MKKGKRSNCCCKMVCVPAVCASLLAFCCGCWLPRPGGAEQSRGVPDPAATCSIHQEQLAADAAKRATATGSPSSPRLAATLRQRSRSRRPGPGRGGRRGGRRSWSRRLERRETLLLRIEPGMSRSAAPPERSAPRSFSLPPPAPVHAVDGGRRWWRREEVGVRVLHPPLASVRGSRRRSRREEAWVGGGRRRSLDRRTGRARSAAAAVAAGVGREVRQLRLAVPNRRGGPSFLGDRQRRGKMMDRAELVSSVEAGGRETRGGGEEAVEMGKACCAPENARWGRGTRIMQRPLQKPLERVHDRFSSNFEDAAMEAEAAGDSLRPHSFPRDQFRSEWISTTRKL
jgi:hypothetical protein